LTAFFHWLPQVGVPRGTGCVRTSAQAADTRVELGHAEVERGEDVRQPRTPGVVEVQQVRADGRKKITHPAGSRHAGRVAEGDAVRAVGADASHDAGHPVRIDVALEGAAETCRDDHLEGRAGAVDQGNQRRDVVEGLLCGPIEVAAVVRVAGRDDDLDLAESGGDGTLRTPAVGNERRIPDLRVFGGPAPDLVGVRHLRYRLGADEGDRLDPPDTGLTQRVDEADLGIGGDRLLVLQAVPRRHLADAHAHFARLISPASFA